MRIAVMVIGLLLSAWVFLLSFFGSSFIPDDSDLAAAVGGALLAALIGGIGSGLALPFPRAAAIMLVIAGLIGYLTISGGFTDMGLYGTIYIGLGVMAFFGARTKRREEEAAAAERAEQRARDERLEQLLTQQRGWQTPAASAPWTISSPSMRPPSAVDTSAPLERGMMRCDYCGAPNHWQQRFCGNCGQSMSSRTSTSPSSQP